MIQTTQVDTEQQKPFVDFWFPHKNVNILKSIITK